MMRIQETIESWYALQRELSLKVSREFILEKLSASIHQDPSGFVLCYLLLKFQAVLAFALKVTYQIFVLSPLYSFMSLP